jgi:hypothetical protein
MLYRRYVTGWFEYYLKADQSYAPFVFNLPGSQTAADLKANRITYARTPPQSALQEWRSTNFGNDAANDEIAGPAADPDRDGLVNNAEYALALDPLAASAHLAPSASRIVSNAQSYGAITFTRATMATDVAITVQGSSALAAWFSGSSYSAAASVPNTTLTSEVLRTGLGIETITVRLNEPFDGTRDFLRLKIDSVAAPAGN